MRVDNGASGHQYQAEDQAMGGRGSVPGSPPSIFRVQILHTRKGEGEPGDEARIE